MRGTVFIMKKFYFVKILNFNTFILGFFFLWSLSGCRESKTYPDDLALKKDLMRATSIIADKNNRQLTKLKRQYESDTANGPIRNLYIKLSSVTTYKEAFKNGLLQDEINETLLKDFLNSTYSVLTEEELKQVQKIFRNTPLLSETINLEELEGLAKLQMALEAELIVQEIYKVVLRNFGTKTPDFDWEIIWA